MATHGCNCNKPTVAEVARAFNVHPATLYRWATEPYRPADAPKLLIEDNRVSFLDQMGRDLYDAKANPAALAARQEILADAQADELRQELIRTDWIDPHTGKARTAQERDAVRDARVKASREAQQRAELDAERKRVEAHGGDTRRSTLGPPVVRRISAPLVTASGEGLAEAEHYGIRVTRDPEPVGVGVD